MSKPFTYTANGGDDLTPEQVIALWHDAVKVRSLVPVGSVEVAADNRSATGLVADAATIPDLADIENWFSYHAPDPAAGDVEAHERIRAAGKAFALVIADTTPSSRERSNAYTAAREAVAWANAARACNPSPGDDPEPPVTPRSIGTCMSTYTTREPLHTAVCALDAGHLPVCQHTDSDGTTWPDEASDKRQGICTTCGAPTSPHPYRHPVTTGLGGLPRNRVNLL